MLVGFGQEICRPVGPRCDLCDVATAKLCPSRRVVTPSPKKKLKMEVDVATEGTGEPVVKVAVEEEVVAPVKLEPDLGSGFATEEAVVKSETVATHLA